jgi:hypothetical protein
MRTGNLVMICRGGVVSGTCDFEIETDQRFRKKNLRRNLKKSDKNDDDKFFVTWKNCKLEGKRTEDTYRLFDGVVNFQDTSFTQDILDMNGVESEVDTTVRTLSDHLRIEDQYKNIVAYGTKLTAITIKENADGDNELASIDTMEVKLEAVSCNALKDVDLIDQEFIFVSGPSD